MAKVEVKRTRNTKQILMIIVASLLLTYGFASLAIDRGNWLWYGLCFGSLYIAVKYIIRLIRK